MQVKISWLLQKPTDPDLHCLQRQGTCISRFSRTRVMLTILTCLFLLQSLIISFVLFPLVCCSVKSFWVMISLFVALGRLCSMALPFLRVLINSRFGVSYSNISFLTPTFWKVSIEKYGKTPTFSGRRHFTPIFKILVRTPFPVYPYI